MAKTEKLFNKGWAFALTDQTAFPDERVSFRPVRLPHDWSVDYPVAEDAPACGSGGYARTGIGWYRKRFAWQPKEEQVTLAFDGVYMNCDIWLNGSHVGRHVYGYTPFECKMIPGLREGENELLIRVDNSHQPNSRWYSGSGITRDVRWIEREKWHFPLGGIHVRTAVRNGAAEIQLSAEVMNPDAREDLQVRTRILAPDGSLAAERAMPVPGCVGTQTLLMKIPVSNPEIWDIDHPALYTAECILTAGTAEVDRETISFGIRTAAFSAEQGFLLNGRKVLLKGVCLHHDGGCVGAAVPGAIWKRRLEKLKNMGCNALRCSHNPPDPALLNLADRMGFVVMDEAFDEWQVMKGKEFGSNTHDSRGYSEWFDSCWQEDIRAMVRRDRNHPSIVMWSAGNEIGEQITEDGDRILRELTGLFHALDPDRPVTVACDQMKAEPMEAREEFLQAADLVGVNYADRWRERTETFFMEEKLAHPEWKLLGTEDIAVNGVRGDYRLRTEESVWGRTPYFAKMLKAEKLWKFLRTRPFMIGSFMWTGIDYLGECFWPEKGSSAGVMDTCGFEKDGFWFYRSLWRQDVTTLFAAPCPDPKVYGEGTVIPVIAYTNAFAAELFLGGKSYGVKAYEFPNQGMTKHWGNFDRKQSPITTNDLHLAWDVPCTGEEVTVVAYDIDGKEIARQTLKAPGRPVCLAVAPVQDALCGDEEVIQVEISLRDEADNAVYDQDLPITVQVTGGSLLGLDNGDPADRTLYGSPVRKTFRGRALAVIRADEGADSVRISVQAPGVPDSVTQVNRR